MKANFSRHILPDEEDDYADMVKRQRIQIDGLNKELVAKKTLLNELKYKFDKAESIIAAQREREKEFNEAVNDAKRAMMSVKCDALALQSKSAQECSQALDLLSGLERHSQFGHHHVSSRTTLGLLLKIREIINNIAELNSGCFVDANARVDSELLKLCERLELENSHLRKSLQSSEEELDETRKKISLLDLIPQYRNEILREECRTMKSQYLLVSSSNEQLKHSMINPKARDNRRELHSRFSPQDAQDNFDLYDPAYSLKEIDIIDAEIDDLKKRLQLAAVHQTRHIIGDALQNLDIS